MQLFFRKGANFVYLFLQKCKSCIAAAFNYKLLLPTYAYFYNPCPNFWLFCSFFPRTLIVIHHLYEVVVCVCVDMRSPPSHTSNQTVL